ncbi:MAG TPA: restriction endonuclease subunit S [Chryseolinea sp.]|nr:restriction endonuclease subunit S [Chryseolinea sp.]
MNSKSFCHKVAELEQNGTLLVQDGNHGEYRPRQHEFGNGKTAFIRASNLDQGRVFFESSDHINDVASNRIRKGIGQGGDIIFSHKGTVGKLALTPLDAPPFVCSPQTTFWRTLNENAIDRRYLYYFMQSEEFVNQWSSRKGETDMADYVSLTAQRELHIRLPHINVQRVIARILGALDEKIELNHQMNHTLEAMAQAIFNSWFVDFDPVTAKADGRKPYGMNDEVAALFPAHFVGSRLGPIPESWNIKSLDEIADFLNGLALQNYPAENDEYLPVIKITELKSGVTEKSDKASTDIPPEYIIDNGDVIFSWSGSLEVVIWCDGQGALNQHLFKVTSKNYPKWFYYFWLLYHLPDFREIASGKATTMGHIRRHDLTDAKVICVDDKIIKVADGIISPLIQKVIENKIQNHTLASIRDTLLPKLLSGEIRIRQAEKLVSKVA